MERIAIILTLIAAVVATVPALAGKAITVKGSDTMVILGQRWAEKYMNANAGQVIMVTGSSIWKSRPRASTSTRRRRSDFAR